MAAGDGKTVAVLGGGVAGLTAAHELRERGYRVTVFDAAGPNACDLGGKARSYEVMPGDPLYPRGPGSGLDAREEAPMFGEHGFRFFPGFYKHVIESMKSIPVGTATVNDLLHDLNRSTFYVRRIDDPVGPESCVIKAFKRWGLALFFAWALVCGWLVWYLDTSWWVKGVWCLAPLLWFVVRTCLFARTARGENSLSVPLQVGPPEKRHRSWLIRHHPCWRYLAVTLAAPLFVLEHPWRAMPFIIGFFVLLWWYPVFATVRYLWTKLLHEIPPGVRPGILESVAASIKVAAVIAASPDRLYQQWERESWWSFISAYRYSRPFQLAFATGLTRSFVATRAERMSARTGATILAQLLFDLAPTLADRDASDRVLLLPTHDAWIRPWVEHLSQGTGNRPAVRFNTFDDDPEPPRARVEVWRLLVEGLPNGALKWDRDDPPTITGFEFKDGPDAEPQIAPHPFDHYVLAVSGTAAQEILMRSGQLISWDRAYDRVDELGDQTYSREFERNLPYLDGIFDLEFGWMTGMVYHLTEPAGLAPGHLLCLESDWALTAIDYGDLWRNAAQDKGGPASLCSTPWRSIISVNVSDWFASSPLATPANFGDLKRVRSETWRQLREHVPELRGIPEPPPFIPDRAVSEMASRPDLAAHAKQPLTNSERLLVNVAGSWHRRPSAQTAFGNLVVAGDYVRTSTDFASMEAANEAAKRAVNVILARDHREQGSTGVYPTLPEPLSYCKVEPSLPVPSELSWPIRVVAALDRPCMKIGLPHPLMLIATPIGWFAGLEAWLRYRFTPQKMAGGRPCERTKPGRRRDREAEADRQTPAPAAAADEQVDEPRFPAVTGAGPDSRS